jgi:hypothetical protein
MSRGSRFIRKPVFAGDVAVRLKPHPFKPVESFYAARKVWVASRSA